MREIIPENILNFPGSEQKRLFRAVHDSLPHGSRTSLAKEIHVDPKTLKNWTKEEKPWPKVDKGPRVLWPVLRRLIKEKRLQFIGLEVVVEEKENHNHVVAHQVIEQDKPPLEHILEAALGGLMEHRALLSKADAMAESLQSIFANHKDADKVRELLAEAKEILDTCLKQERDQLESASLSIVQAAEELRQRLEPAS